MKKIKDGDSNPIISIIIPFYNTPLYKLDRCLKSILCNTKVKFEIILVDDGSHYKNFIEIYRLTKNHSEIHLIRHKKNQGLYSARITALKQIKGKYFGFVDSDDYISKNYFNKLVQYAEDNDADVAVGQIVLECENGYRYIQNKCFEYPYGYKNINAYEAFWKQEGRCYSFHVIWNKIYNTKIWKLHEKFLSDNSVHFVMTEDFVFSAVFLSKINKIINVPNATYYYVQSSESVIGEKKYKSYLKNIKDMKVAFTLAEKFLKYSNLYCVYKNNFIEWKNRYARYWTRNIIQVNFSTKKKDKCIKVLADTFGEENIKLPYPEDDEYYNVSSDFKEKCEVKK